MRLLSLSSFVFLAAVFSPIAGYSAVFPRVGIPLHSVSASFVRPRPSVVENGGTTVIEPFPTGQGAYPPPSGLAFTPDGTAFFFDGNQDEIGRLSPNGTFTRLSVPGALAYYPGYLSGIEPSYAVLYANGYIWMSAKNGIERILPDGSRRQHYFFGTTQLSSVARGTSGAVFAVVYYQETYNTPTYSSIYRVNVDGTVTTILKNQQQQLGNIVAGTDGSMYVAYQNDNIFDGGSGILRINLDGSVSNILTIPNVSPTQTDPGSPEIGLTSLAFSLGSVYFHYDYFYSFYIHVPDGLARLDPNGTLTKTPYLPQQQAPPGAQNQSSIAVDQGGNLWMFLQSKPPFSDLVEYDVRRGSFYNPIFPGSVFLPYYTDTAGEYLVVGPDDNIWWTYAASNSQGVGRAALVSYVRKVQTLAPSSLTLASGNASNFSVSETHYSGPWTARSLDPTIATVSPASSTTGAFVATGVGHGTTSIAVTDRLGNVSYESIAVP